MSRYRKFSGTYFAAIALDVTHIVDRFWRGYKIGTLALDDAVTLKLPCPYTRKLMMFKDFYLCVTEIYVTLVRVTTLKIYKQLVFKQFIRDIRITFDGKMFCVVLDLDEPAFVCDEDGVHDTLLLPKKMITNMLPYALNGCCARFGMLVYYSQTMIYLDDKQIYKEPAPHSQILDCAIAVDGSVCALISTHMTASIWATRIHHIHDTFTVCYEFADVLARSIAITNDGALLVLNESNKLVKINSIL